jgi:hypothetical protein
LDVFHFPVAFPEVFLRRRPGFDVILGNPPWQEVTVEELGFWTRHFPGLKGLDEAERESRLVKLKRQRPDLVERHRREVDQAKREREVLVSGLYPGMGTGDPDLYKAFAWRFRQLAAEDRGCVGVVLPRSATSALGSQKLREEIFLGSDRVTVMTLLNRAGWVFPEAEHRYTIALMSFQRGGDDQQGIVLRGPFGDLEEWEAGKSRTPHRFTAPQVLGWTSSASLPLLPTDNSVEVFAQLRDSPRLDLNEQNAWRARPDRELDATNDRPLMPHHGQDGERLWPVFKGESFDLWQPDRGPAHYYRWADPRVVLKHLEQKRLRSALRRGNSAHSEFAMEHVRDASTLAPLSPRIAFRDGTNRTNQRTVIAALVPPRVFCANQAPYLLWPRGDERDVAFLLAVLCSISLDWYARRFVELHVNFFVLNPFPIPRPPRSDPHWQRAVALAGRLACPDDRFAAWAATVGVEHGPLAPARKQAMIEELDAVVARLYGLSPDQLIHIFDTFHDWRSERERADWSARRDRTVAMLRGLG